MAEIMVTSRELKNKAEELRSQNTSLKSAIETLGSLEAELASMWEGSAKDAFHNAFTKDKGQMETFKSTIDQYAAALDEIAAKYAQAEAANANIANTRNY
ncbi:MAG: WXG100 family type VII secretion target [Ruminococcus sp.]